MVTLDRFLNSISLSTQKDYWLFLLFYKIYNFVLIFQISGFNFKGSFATGSVSK
ncbi:hypothetical protein WN943_016077 [Citrus x changshan-huyou]